MDGSMWYANGGGGIFEHVDGPYAGPAYCDPVVRAAGFGGVSVLDMDASMRNPDGSWVTRRALRGVPGVSGDGWPVMPGLAGFGALGADDATAEVAPVVFTAEDDTKFDQMTEDLVATYQSGKLAKTDAVDRAIQGAGTWAAGEQNQQQNQRKYAWIGWAVGGTVLAIGVGAAILAIGSGRRRS